MRRALVVAVLAAAIVLVGGAAGASAGGASGARSAAVAPPVGSIAVNGINLLPRVFTTYELAILPQRTVSVVWGGVTHTESGPLISDLMTFLGWQPNASCRHDVLRWWILAANAKGETALVTRGEIDPLFGNRPAILSISEDGKFLTHVGPRLVVPGDQTAGRAITAVNQLTVGRAPAQLAQAGCDDKGAVASAPALGTVMVNGDVSKPGTVTFAQLQGLAQTTQIVNFLNGNTPVTATEIGPVLQSVVLQAEPKFDTNCKNDQQRFYIAATGSDGYTSILSWGDIDSSLGARNSLISLNENGNSLAATGPRVTSPGDVRGGRYVSGSVILTVIRAKPTIALKNKC